MKQWILNFPVGVKLALAPLLVAISLCVVAAASAWSNQQASQAIETLTERNMPRLVQLRDIKEQVVRLHGSINQSLAYVGMGIEDAKITALDKQIERDFAAAKQAVNQLRKSLASDGNAQTTESLDAAEKALEGFRTASNDALDMKSTALQMAGAMTSRADRSYAQLQAALTALADAEQQRGVQQADLATRTVHTTTWVTLVLTAAAIVLAVGVTWALSHLIISPLAEAVRVAQRVAQGDLSVRAHATSTDATGQVLEALGTVTRQLNQMVGGIHSAANEIDTASAEIAAGNADLSVRTEHTASELQVITISLQTLLEQVRLNAETVTQASGLAQRAAQVAHQGGDAVGEAVQRMDAIHQQSRRIAEIIGLIDGIAFQTNILSLNAAVEAARAGEQGRGFAVVASEVRALAQRSSGAARDIRNLINDSVEQIDAGSGVVRQAGQTMRDIVEAAGRVSSMMSGITQATTTQAQSLQGIQSAVVAMDTATQQNTALVEQATAATQSLKAQVGGLVDSIAAFRT